VRDVRKRRAVIMKQEKKKQFFIMIFLFLIQSVIDIKEIGFFENIRFLFLTAKGGFLFFKC
jgi:hypothetical protein